MVCKHVLLLYLFLFKSTSNIRYFSCNVFKVFSLTSNCIDIDASKSDLKEAFLKSKYV